MTNRKIRGETFTHPSTLPLFHSSILPPFHSFAYFEPRSNFVVSSRLRSKCRGLLRHRKPSAPVSRLTIPLRTSRNTNWGSLASGGAINRHRRRCDRLTTSSGLSCYGHLGAKFDRISVGVQHISCNCPCVPVKSAPKGPHRSRSARMVNDTSWSKK